jgi:hypothetical protein
MIRELEQIGSSHRPGGDGSFMIVAAVCAQGCAVLASPPRDEHHP